MQIGKGIVLESWRKMEKNDKKIKWVRTIWKLDKHMKNQNIQATI